MLSAAERDAIVSALWDWAETLPDVPVAGFLGADLQTPRQLAVAVERGTDDGQALLELFEHGVRREGLAAVTARIRRRLLDPV